MANGGAAAPHVVVIGAGITGLSTAYYLKQARPDVRVTLLEKRERVGGNIVTERHEGFLLDGGPDSFLSTKPHALQLCTELGLGDELIRPTAHVAHVARGGRLVPMPAGMVLSIPTRFWPFVSSELLSWRAKLRLLGDLFHSTRGQSEHGDESIEAFMSRHFGREAAAALAGPLLGGIYAGDASQLSLAATFPQLLDMERRHGSLIRGFLKSRAQRAADRKPSAKPGQGAESPFVSLKGGLGRLVSVLEERIGPDNVKLGANVSQVKRSGAGFEVALADGTTLHAAAVALTLPAYAAALLVPDNQLGEELRGIRYRSTATVFLGLKRESVSCSLDGLGFIVPPGEARLLAGTWVSSKWAGRAPAGSVLVRGFLGGAHGTVPLHTSSDAELSLIVHEELSRLLGKLGPPLFSRVFRYPDASPQPLIGHTQRLRRIAEQLANQPGLYLAGAAYDGVGIPDCVRQARNVAERIVREQLV